MNKQLENKILSAVCGHVNLAYEKLKSIPETYSMRTLSGIFSCTGNNLTSINNCPKMTDNYFTCLKNDLFCLDFAPLYMRCDIHFRSFFVADDFA